MDIGHAGETREPGPDPTRCPSCSVPYRTPLDQRYGYCWEEHDFMGVPEVIVMHGDEDFSERVADKMRHMPPRHYPVMTDEEREEVLARNRDAFREEEHYALRTIESTILPGGTSLIGSFGHGAMLHEQDPTWWQRLRGGQPARGGEVQPREIEPDERLCIRLSPGARLLSGEDAVRHLMRRHVEAHPPTWRERARWRLRDARDRVVRRLSARR